MFERLEQIEAKYDELNRALASPDIVSDSQRYQKTAKAHSEIAPIVERYREYKDLTRGISESKALLVGETDPEMLSYAQDELTQLEKRVHEVEEDLKVLLLPKDPNDEKNVIMELRAAAGGDEAGLFAEEVMQMYLRYAAKRGWQAEIVDMSPGNQGGIKDATLTLSGDAVYSSMKWESGVHRVQRVPATETQGRIHTSTITVAVMPEAEEVDVQVEEKDLKIDVYRSSGPGGQSVNTTDSAVRITHLPTGLVVEMQDERSQLKNKDKAMKILRSRLLEQKQEAAAKEHSEARKSMVGTGDRSEKIRTYHFKENRVTDHRVNFTLYRLTDVLNGDLVELLDHVFTHYQAEKLKDATAVS